MAELGKKEKKGGKRTKLAMELIKDKKQRHVSFSKRKKGLFGKSAALCSMFSGTVEVAIIVFSQKGKLFSFGHPSTDAVLNRYFALQDGPNPASPVNSAFWWDNFNVDDMNFEELQLLKSSLEELRNRALSKIQDLGLGFAESEINLGDTVHDFLDDFVSFDNMGSKIEVDGGLMSILSELQNCCVYMSSEVR